MKKIFLLFLLLTFPLILISCNNSKDEEFIITFDMNGYGDKIESQKSSHIPNELPNPTFEGYTFEGWFVDRECDNEVILGVKLNTDIILYAKWTENKYTLSFEALGLVLNPHSVVCNKIPTNLPVLELSGYEFAGWYYDEEYSLKAESGQNISSDTKLYAKWVKNEIGIIFDTCGIIDNPEMIICQSVPSKLPILECEGFIFEGWYYDKDYNNLVKANDTITSITTIYAKWLDIRKELTFEQYKLGYKQKPIKISRIPDDLPQLEHDGYIFGGWFYDDAFTNPVIVGDLLEEDTTIYAKWDIKKYSITLNPSGYGKIEVLSELLYIPDELPEIETDGYIFDGWYIDENLTTKVELGLKLDGDITLYAKWNKDTGGFDAQPEEYKANLSASGYLYDKISDFSCYEKTDAYVKVTNAEELAIALYNAKYQYNNIWNSNTNTVEQELIKAGTVHVIEIMNDINLGYNVISDQAKSNGLITNYIKSNQTPTSKMVIENGISQIKIENTSNLIIFSKCGAKLTHAGFKLTSCHNVVFRNLEMDELWEWEDSSSTTPQKIGDYDKFGWAYFKISHCGQIWIDHMTFGKSYDGQIDYSNPVSNTESTKFRLAYGSDGTNGLHISFCNFNAGSDDKDGYLYKMMNAIEQEYLEGKTNYLYYNALRNSGITFEEILYGLAIPQKKGFLLGDNADYGTDDYNYNLKMKVSFTSCKFINFCDRIPKVRGGDCYIYNSIADSKEYYNYRIILKEKNADQAVKTVNSTWKAALVSQGIVVGSGGYVHIENTIYKWIAELAKNNDNITNNSGYIDLINFSYQLCETADEKVGSTRGDNPQFKYSAPLLCVPDYIWPKDGVIPFEISAISLNKLEAYLNNEIFGSGTRLNNSSWLKVNY